MAAAAARAGSPYFMEDHADPGDHCAAALACNSLFLGLAVRRTP